MLSRKHIHKWELYVPQSERIVSSYLDMHREPSDWIHRKCECGLVQRCKVKDLVGYSVECKPFADEEWEDAMA
jgi:hypothetical protein